MTVDIDGEELIDAREVATRLGLKNPRAVLDLRIHRLGFPAPVGRQGRTLLWSWPQVELWGGATDTSTGTSEASGEARLTVR